MDAAHWPQGIGVVKATMEQPNNITNNNNNNNNNNSMIDNQRGATTTRPQKDQAINCPRCNSTNTKFCYYNNYSLTQPRYFCKTCRRYWTEGGSLRNVPVGGGSRKNKRSSSPSSSNKKIILNNDHQPLLSFPLHQNPKLIHQGQDLNLAYPPPPPPPQSTSTTTTTSTIDHLNHPHHHNMSRNNIPFLHDHHIGTNPSIASTNTIASTTTTNSNSSPQQVSAMELLKTGITSRGLMSSFMSMPVMPDHHHHQFSSFANLGHHEFKPSLSFGLDQYHHHHHHHEVVAQETNNSARLLFPNEDLKQVSSNTTNTTATTTEHDHDHDHDHDHTHHDGHQFEHINRGQGDNNSSSGGYNWNGMLGGGNW